MNSSERILTMLLRLQSGAKLTKSTLSSEFEVTSKTIQRDLATIKYVLQEHDFTESEIGYDPNLKSYFLSKNSSITKKDVLILSKILLENRAFNKNELNDLIHNLLNLLSPKDQKEVKTIINSEQLNYEGLSDSKDRIPMIWTISEAIFKEQMLDIEYSSTSNKKTHHILFPVSLFYDAHYFYLVAHSQQYKDYRTFRIDRIKELRPSSHPCPDISYGRKYRDGDVRNLKVDAFEGKKIRFIFSFIGNPEIVYDQFPRAIQKSTDENSSVFEVSTQNTPGLKRWILARGTEIEVKSPPSLVNEVKQILQDTLNKYNK